MRESDLDESVIYSYSLVLMRFTNRELGRRTVDELSELLG